MPDLNTISLDPWDHAGFRENDLQVDVLRLDKIHPEISGNKWFKLKYYLEKARRANKQKLISFGGAYSNHLLALAVAAKTNGFSSIGIIRGEEPALLSHTMIITKEYGMELRFHSRRDYNQKKKSAALQDWDENDPDALMIPEGGEGLEGILGAEEILPRVPHNLYSHICCAVGTGTTLAGVINSAGPNQKIIGVSVLKGTRDFEPLNLSWLKNPSAIQNVQMIHADHFGGYAKYTETLIDFMNRVFAESGIPTDFVYTGKLLYSVDRMASMQAFPAGSRILVLHTGGLQGNRSLAPGLLQF
jgi:1-aminocyclopropane-1-carboxylate deaminase/D-cysteine desulfhydrase-like pyridoxal-dependent ACC family enzyme